MESTLYYKANNEEFAEWLQESWDKYFGIYFSRSSLGISAAIPDICNSFEKSKERFRSCPEFVK